MKRIILFLLAALSLSLQAAETKPKDNLIILDETRVKNLGIETVEAEESAFETTIFALGRIEVLPGKRAVVSSRIPGRAFSVLALPHQTVEEGEELMWVESRQPGDPPPTVMLAAPISGLISKVDIAVGQPITADQTLIEIIDLASVEAAADVPQHLAGKLALGLTARIRVSALPDKVFEAKLAHLGAYADEQKGTIEAAFHVTNPDKILRPGMRAEFSIATSRRENVMSVPRAAIQGDAGNRFVYVKDFDLPNAFLKTPVIVGEINDRSAEIISGLLPADEVVTRGAYSLGFAGASSVSLKEALDAAHGHEHADDGSELTPEKKAAQQSKKKGASPEKEHDHQHGDEDDHEAKASPFWKYVSALLGLLLIISLVTRPAPRDEAESDAEEAKPAEKPAGKEAE
ncbi:MAG: efflux RND transporter periplasmic adaptor subunit [Verrucomicrobiota bacterium]